MKKVPKATRWGYPGSGIVFYFVDANTPEEMRRFFERLPWSRPEKTDCGFTYARPAGVFRGVFEEATDDGFLYEVYVAASRHDSEGAKFTDAQWRRVWHHEAGHAASVAAAVHEDICRVYSKVAPEEVAAVGGIETVALEAPALFTEFLCDIVDIVTGRLSGPPESLLPAITPWAPGAGVRA